MTMFKFRDPSKMSQDEIASIQADWNNTDTEKRFVMFATAVSELVNAVNTLSDRQKQLEDTIAALLIREMK